MKKTLLFFATLLFVQALSAQATYSSAIQQIMLPNISSNYNNPICQWDDFHSIINLKDTHGVNYFCVVEYSSFFTQFFPTIPIPSPILTGRYATVGPTSRYVDMTVNDIYYTDNHAFFCGSIVDNNNVEKAIVGCFDPNEIVSTGNTNFAIWFLSDWLTNAPTTLYRLVAYMADGKYDVVAFGDDMFGSHDLSMTKIVEIKLMIKGEKS